VTYECAAYRLPDETLMVTAEQTLVLVDPSARRPVAVPERFREPVRAFEGADLVE
jgi:acyl-CoA thioesterase FadM